MKHIMTGFTLIELMIAVTIVAVLAGIAIPSYLNYNRRAYYSEIVAAVGPAKVGVTECFQEQAALAGCNGGTNYVPADITVAAGGVTSVTTAAGVITVVPVAQHGILATDTYILTPTPTNGVLIWAASGGGVANGYAQQ